MPLAGILRSKLDGEFSRPMTEIEDLLTSLTFGSLQYVPLDLGLRPFLALAQTSGGAALGEALEGVVGVHGYEFWPSWPARPDAEASEPELILNLQRSGRPDAWVLVEAKLSSGKSSFSTASGPVSDQLAKYWVHLRERALAAGAEPLAVVYVTRHTAPPIAELEQSQSELKRKGHAPAPLYWLSWRRLPEVIEESAPQILRDLRTLLVSKWDLGPVQTEWGWPRRGGGDPRRAWAFDPDWSWPAASPRPRAWSFEAKGARG